MPKTSHIFSRNRAGRSAPRAPPRSTVLKKKANPKAKAGPSPRLQKQKEPANDASSEDPQPDTAQDQQPLSPEASDDDDHSLGEKRKRASADASASSKRKKRRTQEVIELSSDEGDVEDKPSKLDILDVAMLLEEDRVRTRQLLEKWHKGARKSARVCTPFPNVAMAFAYGLDATLDDDEDDDDPVSTDIPADDLTEYKLQCDIYLREMPFLKRDLQRLLSSPKATLLYASFITDRASAQRGDDIGSIVDRVIGYTALIPDLAKYHGPGHILAGKLPKSERGWHHALTAELLCPQSLLAKFKLAPEQFMADVRAEKHEITADDHASFLYDQAKVDEDDPRAGLLRGPLVFLIYQSLYLGPNAVTPNSERSGGRPPFAVNHTMTQCCPRSIVYAAVLARHVLNSQKSWGRTDGGFSNVLFARRLLEPFESKAWSRETLAWWNQKIFGATVADAANRRGPRVNSAAAKIAALIAAEKAAEEADA